MNFRQVIGDAWLVERKRIKAAGSALLASIGGLLSAMGGELMVRVLLLY
jgi:hypothetical protein